MKQKKFDKKVKGKWLHLYHQGLCFTALQKAFKFFLFKDRMSPVDWNVFCHRLKKENLVCP